MKPAVFFVLIFSLFFAFWSCSPAKQVDTIPKPESSPSDIPDAAGPLSILTYDSFVSEWGPGQAIIDGFKKSTGLDVSLISVGDAGQLLQSLMLPGGDATIDLVIGLDNSQLLQVKQANLVLPYRAERIAEVLAQAQFDSAGTLTPYDYGYFSIIYDSQKIKNPPKSLEDLCKPEFARQLVLMDPRTSTPGLGFFLWVRTVYGKDWQKYWSRLKPSILTVAQGWDEGYGLFVNGEASLVLSYTTSPAYHLENENTDRYKAAIFEEGHPVQIEGAGIIAKSVRKKAAQRFLDWMLGDEAQEIFPLGNYMFPVREVKLPGSFQLALVPPKTISVPDEYRQPTELAKSIEVWLTEMGTK